MMRLMSQRKMTTNNQQKEINRIAKQIQEQLNKIAQQLTRVMQEQNERQRNIRYIKRS